MLLGVHAEQHHIYGKLLPFVVRSSLRGRSLVRDEARAKNNTRRSRSSFASYCGEQVESRLGFWGLASGLYSACF